MPMFTLGGGRSEPEASGGLVSEWLGGVAVSTVTCDVVDPNGLTLPSCRDLQFTESQTRTLLRHPTAVTAHVIPYPQRERVIPRRSVGFTESPRPQTRLEITPLFGHRTEHMQTGVRIGVGYHSKSSYNNIAVENSR